MVVVAKSMQTRGNLHSQHNEIHSSVNTYMRRQTAPALLLVPFLRICRRGPAAELITLLISPATNSSTIKNIVPVKTPIRTQPIMTLGPSLEGFGISAVISTHLEDE